MTSSMTSSRKSVVAALKGKLDTITATNFEKEIYKMCQRLSDETDEPLEDIYNQYAYEKVGDIMVADGDEEMDKVRQDIKNDVLDWDSAPYKDFRERRDEDNTNAIQGIVTEVSDYKCKAKDCQSRECIQTQLQTRSGDEGFTTFVTCMKCGKRYRVD